MADVVLRGWQAPVQKIPLVKLLQAQAGLSLADAKHTVDRVLEREPVRVVVPSSDEAKRLAEAAERLGVSAVVETALPRTATPARAT